MSEVSRAETNNGSTFYSSDTISGTLWKICQSFKERICGSLRGSKVKCTHYTCLCLTYFMLPKLWFELTVSTTNIHKYIFLNKCLELLFTARDLRLVESEAMLRKVRFLFLVRMYSNRNWGKFWKFAVLIHG
jgi:hypothetical protein